MSFQALHSNCRVSSWAHSASSIVPAGGPQQLSRTLVPVISVLAVALGEARASKSNLVASARHQSARRPATTARALKGHSRLSAAALEAVISDGAEANEAKVVLCGLKEAEFVAEQANAGSRVIAVCGRDGVGKSKVCAALLELGEPSASRTPAESPHFADKTRLLELESAEERRNFSCYNHIYSQKASDAGLPQRLHLIDTPGHADRLPLVDHALRVAHGAVVVCSVRGGVDAACGRIFEAVERSGKPSVVFLNGVDKEDDADGFDEALDALEQRLGIRPVVLFAPVHISGAHTGSLLLNVLDNSVCSALECSDADVEAEGTAVGELAAWAKKLRYQQIKSLAAVDDDMRLAFAEFDGDVPRMLVQSTLRRAAAAGLIMPLVAGSAKSGLGVDALQEVLRSFIPAADAPPLLRQLGLCPSDVDFSPKAPFLGWAFGRRCKSDDDETLLQVRVLEGVLRPEQRLKAVGRADVFAPARLLAHGPRGELVRCRAAGPGDLVIVPAPAPLVQPGLVLVHEKRQLREGPSAPPPPAAAGPCTFVLQLGGLCEDERRRLLQALEQLAQDGDGLALAAHGSNHALSCMGALHLELLRERLAEDFAISELPLKVAYRATLSAGCSRASHGLAEVEVTPGSRGSGVQIEAFGGVLAEGAIYSSLEAAGPGGMRVTDIRVRLLRADCEESAVAAAVREAVRQAPRLALLEPIVELEVEVPQHAVEAVIEDLRGRRGEAYGARVAEGESRVVEADVPLREILNYCGELERLASGKGFYKYRLKGYREVESALAEHILEHEVAAVHEQRPALVDVECAQKSLVA